MSLVELNSADLGRSVEVEAGGSLVITLPENPTTGYRWSLQPTEPALVVLESDEYVQGSGVGLGGGGIHKFVFRAHRAGSGHLSLALKRPWEESVANHWAITLKVR